MTILGSKKVISKSHRLQLNYLPNHLLSEILARVASASFTDLHNAKTTCKNLLEAGSEDYIFKHVSIEPFPVIPWRKNGAAFFLEKCLSCENPESLFRQGMIEYFSESKSELGIEYLKRASEKGHVAAKYVYGIVLICYGGEFRERGLKLVMEVNGVVDECRVRVKIVIGFMLVRNYKFEVEELKVRRRNCGCRDQINGRRKRSKEWTNFEEFDDGVSCESCLWDIEAVRFCHMLRTRRFTRHG